MTFYSFKILSLFATILTWAIFGLSLVISVYLHQSQAILGYLCRSLASSDQGVTIFFISCQRLYKSQDFL